MAGIVGVCRKGEEQGFGQLNVGGRRLYCLENGRDFRGVGVVYHCEGVVRQLCSGGTQGRQRLLRLELL